jgi:NAD-reducing hydrogenase large subunit
MHLGQMISSHALSFFHLSSPDFLLGWDTDPATRNILGIAEKFPDLAKRGIRLRKFGQEASERITGKKVHAIGITAGGMTMPLTEENRKALLDWVPEALETTKMGLDIFKRYCDTNKKEMDEFASFKTLYLGTVGPKGELELYDGRLRYVDAEGKIVADQLDPKNYLDFVAERPVEWSYLKYPYYKPLGYPDGIYRVGPLARLNVASVVTTPVAQKEFLQFKSIGAGKPLHGSFYYHYARLIETLYSIEEMKNILSDPRVTSTEIFAEAGRNQSEGVGSSEAPRGTLFHHYFTDENGILKKVNLVIATGQNNPAMNRSVLEVAKRYVTGKDVKEGALNRVEAAIRCYDPCLSCSTHSIGSMPLLVEIRSADGRLVNTVRRPA